MSWPRDGDRGRCVYKNPRRGTTVVLEPFRILTVVMDIQTYVGGKIKVFNTHMHTQVFNTHKYTRAYIRTHTSAVRLGNLNNISELNLSKYLGCVIIL